MQCQDFSADRLQIHEIAYVSNNNIYVGLKFTDKKFNVNTNRNNIQRSYNSV